MRSSIGCLGWFGGLGLALSLLLLMASTSCEGGGGSSPQSPIGSWQWSADIPMYSLLGAGFFLLLLGIAIHRARNASIRMALSGDVWKETEATLRDQERRD